MSQTNPTKGQILNLVKSDYAKYYDKSIHNTILRKFYQKYDRKATLDDAQEIIKMFEDEWAAYYDEYELQSKEESYESQFYSFCVSLKVDVKKAVTRFIELFPGVTQNYPLTFIIEGSLWNDFKHFVRQNKGSLRHIHPNIIKKREKSLPKKDYNDKFSQFLY